MAVRVTVSIKARQALGAQMFATIGSNSRGVKQARLMTNQRSMTFCFPTRSMVIIVKILETLGAQMQKWSTPKNNSAAPSFMAANWRTVPVVQAAAVVVVIEAMMAQRILRCLSWSVRADVLIAGAMVGPIVPWLLAGESPGA